MGSTIVGPCCMDKSGHIDLDIEANNVIQNMSCFDTRYNATSGKYYHTLDKHWINQTCFKQDLLLKHIKFKITFNLILIQNQENIFSEYSRLQVISLTFEGRVEVKDRIIILNCRF